MMKELVFAQALLVAGELEARERELLRLVCNGAVSALALRLRSGVTPEDCREDFVTAASLYALAALQEGKGEPELGEFKAGDLTVKQWDGGQRSALALRQEADRLIFPYLADSFLFLGV